MCQLSLATVFLLALCVGCSKRVGSSSYSVEDARSRGLLIAEYSIPVGVQMGPYVPLEVWIEKDRKLVVRLNGPHVDAEPRIAVRGLTDTDYVTIWSERGGPPYEIWTAPDPVPESLVLERGEFSLEIHRRE